MTIRRKRLTSFLLALILGLVLTRVMFEVITDEIAIFGFHDIINLDNPDDLPPKRIQSDGDYTKQDLEKFIDSLVVDNYWFLSSQELYDYFLNVNRKKIPEEHQGQRKVMLTIDDGYKSAHVNLIALAESIEAKYNQKIKFVWFLNPPFLGVKGVELDHASCADFREGLEKGFYDLQSHGANHKDLTTLQVNELQKELLSSQEILRKCTQDLDPEKTVAAHIAYPFGEVNDQVRKYASKYYLSGYLYNNSTFKLGWWSKDNYQIPRVSIHSRIPVQRLLRLAAGGWL
ncbi:MAG: polysaccharide deacetylase family protein [Symploca sp. SIO1B1]|nr:polysaccharide deacetylase family protein [Symploca sp. SIO2D2]NER24195.1 polysaccharide deacetylase family protein [Symploca sp. SIO1C2]NER46272.1 polysaccharide deacetylase family protein [Symploca sp. SIO1A3]NER95004.1 polysaccharide deacetylase family protein [Symploca sp. SIO1B1]